MVALRQGLAVAGFVLAVGAVVLDNPAAGWAGIVLLAGSLLLRVAARGSDRRGPDAPV